jgi:hypothetical protein
MIFWKQMIPPRGMRHILAVVGVLGLSLQPASAYTVVAPNSVVAGKSISDWTADWWAWALRAPNATDPLSDTTGAYANVNNAGPVFFVAGNTATRTFTVPAGTPLLLPLINAFDIEPDTSFTLADREAAATLVVDAFMASVDQNSLFASIDGNSIANLSDYQEVTDLFGFGPVQAGSVLNEYYGVAAGTDTYPTKSGGYWLMIDGLAPGPHTLEFGGSFEGFSVDTPVGPEALPAASSATTALIGVPEPGSAALLLSVIPAVLVFRRRTC